MDNLEQFLSSSVMTAEQQASLSMLAGGLIQFYKHLIDGGIPEQFAMVLTSQLFGVLTSVALGK